MANKITNTDNYSAIASAIREKLGTNDTYRPGDMAAAIATIPSVQAEWYNDGNTHIWIHIDPDTPASRMTYYLNFSTSEFEGVEVDWGDGTIENLGATNPLDYPHTYATPGDYVITLTVQDGTMNFSRAYGTGGAGYTAAAYNKTWVTKIEFGDDILNLGPALNECYALRAAKFTGNVMTIAGNLFSKCSALASVILPVAVTEIPGYSFYYCYGLQSIELPDTVATIGSYAFQECYSLMSVTIPAGMTTIASYTFYFCYGLTRVTIPGNITRINWNAFSGCRNVAEYHIKATTPPTLDHSNALPGVSDRKIYVPYSADHSILAAYQEATNWASLASYIEEEPAA